MGAKTEAGVKAGVFGIVAAIALGVVANVAEACPTLIDQWPMLVSGGVMAGVGKWMHSRRPKCE